MEHQISSTIGTTIKNQAIVAIRSEIEEEVTMKRLISVQNLGFIPSLAFGYADFNDPTTVSVAKDVMAMLSRIPYASLVEASLQLIENES